MGRVVWPTIAAGLLALVAFSAAGLQAAGPTPVLIELFTAEGCSSCPPADELLRGLVASQPISGALIIGLGEHVDYWDRLGWKDRFSSASLTARQERYGRRFNVDAVYTPQMVVDGRDEFVGSDAAAARRAIGKALARESGVVSIAISPASGDQLSVAVTMTSLPKGLRSKGDVAELLVAIIEKDLKTDIRGGENKGRLLSHAPVVRSLTMLGDVEGEGAVIRGSLPIRPDWQLSNVSVVAFVQERDSRHVLAAAVVPARSPAR